MQPYYQVAALSTHRIQFSGPLAKPYSSRSFSLSLLLYDKVSNIKDKATGSKYPISSLQFKGVRFVIKIYKLYENWQIYTIYSYLHIIQIIHTKQSDLW